MIEAVFWAEPGEKGSFMKILEIVWKVLENQFQIQECFDARVIFDLYDLGRS